MALAILGGLIAVAVGQPCWNRYGIGALLDLVRIAFGQVRGSGGGRQGGGIGILVIAEYFPNFIIARQIGIRDRFGFGRRFGRWFRCGRRFGRWWGVVRYFCGGATTGY